MQGVSTMSADTSVMTATASLPADEPGKTADCNGWLVPSWVAAVRSTALRLERELARTRAAGHSPAATYHADTETHFYHRADRGRVRSFQRQHAPVWHKRGIDDGARAIATRQRDESFAVQVFRADAALLCKPVSYGHDAHA